MYNSDLPTRAELPTSKQLLRSTLIAAASAIFLLITTVLPAEYGIDPTGAGRFLGLTTMGEIKASLADEIAQDAAAEQNAPQLTASDPVTSNKQATPSVPLISAATAKTPEAQVLASSAAQPFVMPLASDQTVIALKPGEASEIKLGMYKGATVSYEWIVAGGTVNFDTHGDAPGLDYHGYGKGRNSAGDSGELEAAFDGKHGWFWRNRSAGSVTITLTTEGDYVTIQRMM